MKTFLIYLLGVATPFVGFLLTVGWWSLQDWRASQRYVRAWAKFGAEFDSLTEQHLASCRARWAEEPHKYDRICDDRSRYFTMRWQYGNTTEA